MSPEFYKVIHLIGLITLFTGIGGFLTYGAENAPRVRMVGILHGVGLLLLLISGFGLSAKLGIGFPWWVILKLVMLLALGALLGLAKRGRIAPRNAVVLALALGFVAAYLGATRIVNFKLPSPAAATTQPG